MKKTVYYDFNHEQIEEGNIKLNDIIEPCRPSTSEWFSSMDFFINGAKNINEYFANLKRRCLTQVVTHEEFNAPTTVKNCIGIKDLFKNSYIIKSPCDFHVSVIPHENEYIVAFNSSDSILLKHEIHAPQQYKNNKNKLFHNYTNLKLALPVLIRSKADYLYVDPVYHNETPLPLKVLPGVIADHQTHDLNINTIVENKEQDFLIKKGTVLTYLYFVSPVEFKIDRNIKYAPRFRKTFAWQYGESK